MTPAKITANEDSALAMTYGTDAVVVAVADGAGGLPAGQRASNTAVAALRNALEQAAREKVLLRTAILNMARICAAESAGPIPWPAASASSNKERFGDDIDSSGR